MSEIIPAILAKSVADLAEKIRALPEAITFFHMDVLEEDLWSESNTRDFEVHLMVEDPVSIIERWINRGAKRLIIHEVDAALARYRDRAEIGLGVEIDKPLEQFSPFLDYVDFVHLMSIKEIGHQGHPFDSRVFDRIREVRDKFPNLPISVDGGISLANYKELGEAGATRLIVGSHFTEIWNSLTKE